MQIYLKTLWFKYFTLLKNIIICLITHLKRTLLMVITLILYNVINVWNVFVLCCYVLSTVYTKKANREHWYYFFQIHNIYFISKKVGMLLTFKFWIKNILKGLSIYSLLQYNVWNIFRKYISNLQTKGTLNSFYRKKINSSHIPSLIIVLNKT